LAAIGYLKLSEVVPVHCVSVQCCINNGEKQCLIFVPEQGGGRRQCGGIVD